MSVNIVELARNDDAGTGIDDLDYHYSVTNNQLAYVDDSKGPAVADYDLDDQQSGNYQYNEIGQLISDAGEDIDQIIWTVTGRCNRKYKPQTDCFSMLCCILQRQDKFVLLFLDAIMFRIEIIGDPDLRQRTLSAYIW